MDQVKNSVAGGLLQPGQQLPSVRELAGELAINPNTVSRAYSILEAENIIQRRQGSGTFVADSPEQDLNLSALLSKVDALMVAAYHHNISASKLRQLFEEALKRWNIREVD